VSGVVYWHVILPIRLNIAEPGCGASENKLILSPDLQILPLESRSSDNILPHVRDCNGARYKLQNIVQAREGGGFRGKAKDTQTSIFQHPWR
jgi:hypothetical protein